MVWRSGRGSAAGQAERPDLCAPGSIKKGIGEPARPSIPDRLLFYANSQLTYRLARSPEYPEPHYVKVIVARIDPEKKKVFRYSSARPESQKLLAAGAGPAFFLDNRNSASLA